MLNAKAVVKELSLDTKIKLLSGKNFWYLPEIKEFNLKSIMLTDGPHGLRKQKDSGDHLGISNSVPATCFPTASALASSWNKDLIYKVGETLGEECLSERVSVLLGPGINIKRNPLCGRNFEYFSEDPYLTGALATSMINGIQSKGIGTSIKHFAVNNQETMRMVVDTIVDERTLRELYLKAFEMAIKASQPWTVMSSYNLINGVYASENKKLLQTILKDEWRHLGIVVTDWGANNDRVRGLIAGQELEMPSSNNLHDKRLKKATEEKKITLNLLDERVERIVELIIKANETLNKETKPYNKEKHHQFAKEVARESMVLLKNEDNILPLNNKKSVALIGVFAKTPRYQGSGSSLIQPTKLASAYDAFKDILGDNLSYAKGYALDSDKVNETLIKEAVEKSKKADVVVIMAGLTDRYESEGFDRDHLELPMNHNSLIEEVVKVNKNVIISLSNGSPVKMPWINNVKAIIEQYLTGQASGLALAEIIFGKVSPSGKLAETFPNDLAEIPSTKYFPGKPRQVKYVEGLYVGYRAYDKLNIEPLFPFGYGLTYTSFKYNNFKVTSNKSTKTIKVSLDLTNTGNMIAKEIVQVYVSKKDSLVYRPIQELKAFEKLELKPEQTKAINLSIAYDDLKVYQKGFKLEPGEYEVRISASSRDTKYSKTINITSNDQIVDDLNETYKNFNKATVLKETDFKHLLGHKIPEYPSIKPYHMNSTLGEIKQTYIGKKLFKLVYKQMAPMIDNETNETTKKMIEKTVEQMPFRSLVIFSEGRLSLKRANGMLDLMNKHFIKGLYKVIFG
ncbi:MAG: glycoside hydrolase family 3 C-terminal domain-containing protein [Candidatus Izimaplasma sp.]|nr:glycoside hydrolase family 3 C-terminal domain-containing protein [Candidatus Izimaplasma bacterium]